MSEETRTIGDFSKQWKAERRTMSNELTNTGRNVFEAYGEAVAPRIGKFLKFAKGDYYAGRDQDLIPLGTVMIADVSQLKIGWVRWWEGRTDQNQNQMGKLTDGFRPPARHELGDNDKKMWERDDRGNPKDPWQPGSELPMVMRDDPEQAFIFTSGSKGGEGACGELSKIYGKRIKTNPDEIPVIRLDVDSYLHPDKTFGRIKFPVFEIIGWVRKDGTSSDTDVGKLPSDRVHPQAQAAIAKAKRYENYDTSYGDIPF